MQLILLIQKGHLTKTFLLIIPTKFDAYCLGFRPNHEVQSRYSRQIHFHFEEISSVTGKIPVVLGEQKKGVFINLISVQRIYFPFDKFLLNRVQAIIDMSMDGIGEVADKEIPIYD